MFVRPQFLVPVAIAIVAIGLLFGLRRNLDDPKGVDARAAAEELEASSDRGSGASSSAFRITNISGDSPLPKPNPARINRIPPKQRREDFEAQMARAWGESEIRGIVLGERGVRVAGAQVQLYENDPMTKNPPLRETTADEDGSFTLTELNDGDMRFLLVARAEGYAPEVRRVIVSGAPVEMYVALKEGVPLSGVVRDAETSGAVAGATVYFPSEREQVYAMLGTVQSGAGGQFAFDAVPKGEVHTLAEMAGYHKSQQALRAPNQEAVIVMQRGGATIRGTTIDRITRKPSPGAKVIARTGKFATPVMSGEDGTFEFLDMPGGKYSLVAVRGMESKPVEFELGPTEVKEDVELVLPADLLVTGRVVHAYAGRSMPGVKVWYSSPAGKKSTISDENGLFGFETMALEEYTLEVHHKNFLPVQEKRTTGSVETLTRKISKTASSDEVILRLRPVSSVEGVVTMDRRGNARPVFGAEVVVAYKQGSVFERVRTQTDPAGRFFVNLPERQRGEAKAVVNHRNMVAVEGTRVPSRKELRLVLKPTRMNGTLALSDKSPLSGVRVGSDYFMPNDQPVSRANRIIGGDQYTNARGRFFMPLPERERVGLTFFLPDGKSISKVYSSDSLLRRVRTFVYDPVAEDILSDVTRGEGERRNREGVPPEQQPRREERQRDRDPQRRNPQRAEARP
jgi:hypothetical protein